MAMFAINTERRAALSISQKAAVFVVAAANLALAAMIALELRAQTGTEISAAPAKAQPTDGLPANDPFVLPPMTALHAVVERPLFAHDRRPLPPPSKAPAVAGDLSTFRLAGITVSGNVRMALVLHGAPPRITALAEGQIIDGWTVGEIGDDHIVLRSAGSESTIHLYKEASVPEKP
jgi:hypothetical protein